MAQPAVNYKKLVQSIQLFNKTVDLQHRTWQKEYSEAEERLSFIQNFEGEATDDNLLLQSGERLLFQIPVGLIEERAGQSRYVGGHAGISIPIGSIGGHSIRYSVGSSRGHIERSAPVETEIDRGLLSVTNTRIIFVGSKQTREADFKKILGINYPFSNRIVISSSNRQKATVLSFDPQFNKAFRLMILIAQADFLGNRDELLKSAVNDINEIRSEEPKLLAIPTEAEANADGFVPPIPLQQAGKTLQTVFLWISTALSLLSSSVPPLSVLLAISGGYFGWKIFQSKPKKKTALIIACVLNVLAMLAAISYIAQGKFLIDVQA